MFNQNREVFSKGTFNLKTQITKEVRTKQTADELKRISGIPVSNVYQVNDTVLRFYDLAPTYTHFENEGAWQKDLQVIKEHYLTGNFFENTAQRFFKKEFLQPLKATSVEAFVTDVYGFFTILPSVQLEMDRAGIRLTADSIKQFFTCPELLSIGKLDQAEDYLLKGPGSNKNGIQIKIAAPLLVDFINSTDAFVKQQEPGVQLRFSHAETIAPFAALLGLDGSDSALKSSKLLTNKIWDAAKVVPLSANIQWILYKSKTTDDYLIKFLLNEKEVQVTGLKTASFPYYNWKSVRSFYINKLQELHLRLTDNLYTYLRNVQ
jgi:multiple inositol-polyphosphate phosphatase/2,3-bisphosphoglycerate 3-phosphatase